MCEQDKQMLSFDIETEIIHKLYHQFHGSVGIEIVFLKRSDLERFKCNLETVSSNVIYLYCI